LADRALRVLDMPDAQWKQMSDAAYQTATNFTMEQATDMFVDALRLAIARSRRGELSGAPAART
jgi:hypothetical protein